MNPRFFAWTAGVLLLLLGLSGFVPPLVMIERAPLRVAAGVGGPQLLGVFPTSLALNVIHTLLGAWGMFGGTGLNRAITFARYAAIALVLLMAMGSVPGADTLFGAAPLYGNNILLHGGLALLCFLFGWLYRRVPAAAAPSAEVQF